MGEMKFSDNYRDHCQQSGVAAGFQFEFFCERCNDTWRTEFVPYRGGQASGWLHKASGLFGGVLGTVGDAVDGLAQSNWGKARDEAFSEALGQAQKHFHRCGKCFQYVCGVCWNGERGLCLNCAPDVEVEVEAAMAEGAVQAAREKGVARGQELGAQVDTEKKRQLVCPECRTETHGAKFCPNCGKQMGVKDKCSKCSAEVAPGTKFCPECGQKLG